jgi:DNA-binding winged helix-turn-helix (wHTH) protein
VSGGASQLSNAAALSKKQHVAVPGSATGEGPHCDILSTLPRYRFGPFILSPRQRILLRGGIELPLIPRYFDLLVFLVERRHEAVHRRDIFERVWTDAIVSDSALSQAIRTLRRTLGDNSREPMFIRTVSRHGYRFVFDTVVEDDDEQAPVGRTAAARGDDNAPAPPGFETGDPFEPLLQRIVAKPSTAADEEEQREAAEKLHALGTGDALARLGTRPQHARARALLRDTRWDVPGAGAVPLFGQPGAVAAALTLSWLRMRRLARLGSARTAGAALGGGLAGIVGGILGGIVLAAAPGSPAPAAVVAVLAWIGACCGAAGGAGVGLGLSIAEATARSRRTITVVIDAAVGGLVVGSVAQVLGRWSLATLVGVRLPIGGALEGFVLGGAAGLGYAIATRQVHDGLATPRGRHRLDTAAVTALTCAAGALVLTWLGRPLVGGTIHAIAQASAGSQAMLTPLGRLMGEADFGPLSRAVIGTGEGGLFGFGLALGLTRRPEV